MKRINISPGKIMMLSYLLGQGIFFIVLAVLMLLGQKQLSGWLAYKMAIVSFAFQMADVGASNILLRAYREGYPEKALSLIWARCAISFGACLVVTLISLQSGIDVEGKYFLLMFPIVGALMGLSTVYLLEARGSYSCFGGVQAAQWIATLGIGLLDYKYRISNGLLMYIPALVIHWCVTRFFARQEVISKEKARQQLGSAFHEMVAVSSAILFGQIWARIVVVQIFGVFGPAVTASFTLARGVLTGFLMFINSWLRSKFTATISHQMRGIEQIKIFPPDILRIVFVMCFGLFIFLNFVLPNFLELITLDAKIKEYFHIFWIAPIWIAYSSLALQWNYVVTGWRRIASDVISSIPMIVSFFWVIDFGPINAIVISDICKAISLFLIVLLAKKKYFGSN